MNQIAYKLSAKLKCKNNPLVFAMWVKNTRKQHIDKILVLKQKLHINAILVEKLAANTNPGHFIFVATPAIHFYCAWLLETKQ